MAPKLLVWYRKLVWILTQDNFVLNLNQLIFYQVRYVPGKSCSEIGFSCSKMAIKGRGISCRGDFLEVEADNQKTRWWYKIFLLSTFISIVNNLWKVCEMKRNYWYSPVSSLSWLVTLSRYCRGRKPSANSASSISVRQVLARISISISISINLSIV